MDRAGYSQANVSTVAPDYIKPSLVALVLAGLVHTLPMLALDSNLVPFCSCGQSIEVACWIRLWISWLSFNLSKMSSFLMWSLLVTPSIFRRHDISKTLSRFCCGVFNVQVSELYNSVLSIIVSWTCSLVALLISLEEQYNAIKLRIITFTKNKFELPNITQSQRKTIQHRQRGSSICIVSTLALKK